MRNHTTLVVAVLRVAMLTAQFGVGATPGLSIGTVAYHLTTTVVARPAAPFVVATSAHNTSWA